jgi:EmrB/QacA subfamily drug resistance transporter
MSVILAIVTGTFPDNERGRAMGVLGSVLAAGVLVGPVLGGLLLDTLGWRAIFYTRVPIGIIGIIMAWALLNEQKAVGAKPTVDFWGAATLIIGLSCLLLFLNLGESLGFTSWPVLLLVTVGVILLALFVIQERRISQPVVDLRLFKNSYFTGGNISLFVSSFSMAFLIFLTPFFMIGAVGISALELGMLIATSPLTSIVVGPLAGWLSDKIGTRFLQTTGITIVSGSLFIFASLTADSTSFDIILGMVVFGIGMGVFSPTVQSSVMGSVPKERLGTASAMTNTVRQLATSVGTVAAGILFTNRRDFHISRLTGGNTPPQLLEILSIVGSYQDALLLAAIICCFGIITSFIGKSKKS